MIKAGTNGGTIDFLVAQKKWGLELLRVRDRISQHVARFEPCGQYSTMIQNEKMEQYAVLDFTDKLPQKFLPGISTVLTYSLTNILFRVSWQSVSCRVLGKFLKGQSDRCLRSKRSWLLGFDRRCKSHWMSAWCQLLKLRSNGYRNLKASLCIFILLFTYYS